MITTEELDALDALANTPEIAAFDGVGGVLSSLPRLLSAAREAETLRAKLAETEQARHEARYYANEVAAERDTLQSRLNQAEHQAKGLRAKLIESEERRVEARQEADAVNERLRDVTALLSDMVDRAGPLCSARGILNDPHCDDDDCVDCDLDDRVIAALDVKP